MVHHLGDKIQIWFNCPSAVTTIWCIRIEEVAVCEHKRGGFGSMRSAVIATVEALQADYDIFL